MQTPSNAWRRNFSPSRIFAHTLIESPGLKSGSGAPRRAVFSIVARMRDADMAGLGKNQTWTVVSARDPTPPSTPAVIATAEQAVEDNSNRGADGKMIPRRGPADRRKDPRYRRNLRIVEAPAGAEHDQDRRRRRRGLGDHLAGSDPRRGRE